jgi:ubiquinone/menaquinone biosynthesis C-methylase UbiE
VKCRNSRLFGRDPLPVAAPGPMPKPPQKFDAESVRAEWDAAADAYADAQATGRDYYRFDFFGPAQVALCGDVRGRRLLDVGCGTGYFAREMALRGAMVTALDVSPGMLAHAQSLEAKAPLGIRYLNGDAARLQDYVGSSSFDMATSCLALQDMPDIARVLRSIHDVLSPGGRLVASIAHPCSDTPCRRWAKTASGEAMALYRSLLRSRATRVRVEGLAVRVQDFRLSRNARGLVRMAARRRFCGARPARACPHGSGLAGASRSRGCDASTVLPPVRSGANEVGARQAFEEACWRQALILQAIVPAS